MASAIHLVRLYQASKTLRVGLLEYSTAHMEHLVLDAFREPDSGPVLTKAERNLLGCSKRLNGRVSDTVDFEQCWYIVAL